MVNDEDDDDVDNEDFETETGDFEKMETEEGIPTRARIDKLVRELFYPDRQSHKTGQHESVRDNMFEEHAIDRITDEFPDTRLNPSDGFDCLTRFEGAVEWGRQGPGVDPNWR